MPATCGCAVCRAAAPHSMLTMVASCMPCDPFAHSVEPALNTFIYSHGQGCHDCFLLPWYMWHCRRAPRSFQTLGTRPPCTRKRMPAVQHAYCLLPVHKNTHWTTSRHAAPCCRLRAEVLVEARGRCARVLSTKEWPTSVCCTCSHVHFCRSLAACSPPKWHHLTVQTPTTMIPLHPLSLRDCANSVASLGIVPVHPIEVSFQSPISTLRHVSTFQQIGGQRASRTQEGVEYVFRNLDVALAWVDNQLRQELVSGESFLHIHMFLRSVYWQHMQRKISTFADWSSTASQTGFALRAGDPPATHLMLFDAPRYAACDHSAWLDRIWATDAVSILAIVS
jgi:hypothetical protein